MARHRIDEETRNVMLASLVVWASVVAGAAAGDVFSKFDAKAIAYFAAGVALYALAAFRMDREMHAYILDFSRGALAVAACLMVATLAAASLGHVPALAVFAAPLATVASAAAIGKLASRPTKARAKSPVGTRAAI
ncbi:MAG TPA: hypothetical protein VGI57_07915 [Usitatibacter sp.]